MPDSFKLPKFPSLPRTLSFTTSASYSQKSASDNPVKGSVSYVKDAPAQKADSEEAEDAEEARAMGASITTLARARTVEHTSVEEVTKKPTLWDRATRPSEKADSRPSEKQSTGDVDCWSVREAMDAASSANPPSMTVQTRVMAFASTADVGAKVTAPKAEYTATQEAATLRWRPTNGRRLPPPTPPDDEPKDEQRGPASASASASAAGGQTARSRWAAAASLAMVVLIGVQLQRGGDFGLDAYRAGRLADGASGRERRGGVGKSSGASREVPSGIFGQLRLGLGQGTEVTTGTEATDARGGAAGRNGAVGVGLEGAAGRERAVAIGIAGTAAAAAGALWLPQTALARAVVPKLAALARAVVPKLAALTRAVVPNLEAAASALASTARRLGTSGAATSAVVRAATSAVVRVVRSAAIDAVAVVKAAQVAATAKLAAAGVAMGTKLAAVGAVVGYDASVRAPVTALTPRQPPRVAAKVAAASVLGVARLVGHGAAAAARRATALASSGSHAASRAVAADTAAAATRKFAARKVPALVVGWMGRDGVPKRAVVKLAWGS